MKKIKIAFFIFICISSFLSWLSSPLYSQYNANNAVQYGNKWWGDPKVDDDKKYEKYNVWGNIDKNGNPLHDPIYYNDYTMDEKGNVVGDCANFVSQCLNAGGIDKELENYVATWSSADRLNYAGKKFDASHLHGAKLYYGVASGGVFGTIANPQRLKNFLIDYYHALYVKGKAPTIPENSVSLDAGDVFLMVGDGMSHSTFIITGSGIDSTYACHTYDKKDGAVPDTYEENRHFFLNIK